MLCRAMENPAWSFFAVAFQSADWVDGTTGPRAGLVVDLLLLGLTRASEIAGPPQVTPERRPPLLCCPDFCWQISRDCDNALDLQHGCAGALRAGLALCDPFGTGMLHALTMRLAALRCWALMGRVLMGVPNALKGVDGRRADGGAYCWISRCRTSS